MISWRNVPRTRSSELCTSFAGRTCIKVPDHTPFYAYIVCDLTPNLVQQAENATLTHSPDPLGYSGYNPNLRTYVEIVSFDKLIGDAKKRNAFLFDQLGIL